jgi:hypothetical protein
MNFFAKLMLRSKEGVAIPQYFNPKTEQFEALEGQGGAGFFQYAPVLDYWEGTGDTNKTFDGARSSVLVSNDGASDIILTVNDMAFRIKPTEVFDEFLAPFTTLTIATASTYRGWVRG